MDEGAPAVTVGQRLNVVQNFPEHYSNIQWVINNYLAVSLDCMNPQCSDPMRVIHMHALLREAHKLNDGDYIEIGIHLGYTLKVIHSFMDHHAFLFALDTFEGFDQRDVDVERGKERQNNYPWEAGSFSPTSPEQVMKYLGYPKNVALVKGWFPDSFAFAKLGDRRFRFAHIDVDLYAPTKAALETLWPLMIPGGIIAVHDYGDPCFATDQAIDEFCAEQGVYPVPLPAYWTTAVIRKV